MTDELDKLSDAELSEVFAVTMGVPCDPDDYATSADAVIPWLEKWPDVEICREKSDGWQVAIMDVRREEHQTTSGVLSEAWEDTFARAACIALIRAKRAEKP